MTIEIPTLISAVSLIIALIVALNNIRNQHYHNDSESASQTATLIVKLESIADGVNEIKADMRNMKNDVQDLRDRLIIVEQSTKSAHHRIDCIENKEKPND